MKYFGGQHHGEESVHASLLFPPDWEAVCVGFWHQLVSSLRITECLKGPSCSALGDHQLSLAPWEPFYREGMVLSPSHWGKEVPISECVSVGLFIVVVHAVPPTSFKLVSLLPQLPECCEDIATSPAI